MLGKLYNRMGQEDKAVSAYLKAVGAGLSMSKVSPFLANIYGIPIEEVTRVSLPVAEEEIEKPGVTGPSVEAPSLSSGTVGR